jgi:hypothetical protein
VRYKIKKPWLIARAFYPCDLLPAPCDLRPVIVPPPSPAPAPHPDAGNGLWVCTALGRAGAVFCALAPALLVCFRFEFGKLVDKIYFCGLDKIRIVWYNMRRI